MPLITLTPYSATLPNSYISSMLDDGSGAIAYDVTTDNSGNVYVVGYTLGNGPGNRTAYIAKYNNTFTFQWARFFGNTSFNEFYSVATDTAGNVYATGTNGLLVKYDSSGNVLWQRAFSDISSILYIRDVKVDSSNNIFIMGQAWSYGIGGGGRAIFAAKLSQGGSPDPAIEWHTGINPSGGNTMDGYGLHLASTGDIYICGSDDSVGGNPVAYVAKLNSSGTVQWQRTTGDVSGFQFFTAVDTDSSNNVYCFGSTSTPSPDNEWLVKLDSSGSLVWGRQLSNSANGFVSIDLLIDGSDGIYTCGTTTNTPSALQIQKWDTSGNITWGADIRDVGTTDGTDGNGVALYGNQLYVAGRTTAGPGAGDEVLLSRMPKDGPAVVSNTYLQTVSTTNGSSFSPSIVTQTHPSGTGTLNMVASSFSTGTASFTETQD